MIVIFLLVKSNNIFSMPDKRRFCFQKSTGDNLFILTRICKETYFFYRFYLCPHLFFKRNCLPLTYPFNLYTVYQACPMFFAGMHASSSIYSTSSIQNTGKQLISKHTILIVVDLDGKDAQDIGINLLSNALFINYTVLIM